MLGKYIKPMAVRQEMLNAVVHPQWRTQKYAWLRAAMLEAAEAMEHYGWKWWKKQEPDLEQFKLELVDIWHFILSEFLQNSAGPNMAEGLIDMNRKWAELYTTHNGKLCVYSKLGMHESLDLFIGLCAASVVNVPLFEHIMKLVGMSADELYKLYIGKNALNQFRQDHGYRDGTYRKVWNGLEDNEHLTHILAGIEQPDEHLYDEVMYRLRGLYPAA